LSVEIEKIPSVILSKDPHGIAGLDVDPMFDHRPFLLQDGELEKLQEVIGKKIGLQQANKILNFAMTQHRYVEGYASIGKDFLQQVGASVTHFRRNYYDVLMDDVIKGSNHGWMYPQDGSEPFKTGGNATDAVKFKPEIEAMALRANAYYWRHGNGKVVAFRFNRAYEGTAIVDETRSPVNMENLKEMEKSEDPQIQMWVKAVYENMDEDNNFVTVYFKGRGDRKTGMGNNIQNMPKKIREKVFSGLVEVDMESAHPSIMNQLTSGKTEALNKAVEDKKQVRKEADKITSGKGKWVMQAVLYGAGLNGRSNEVLTKTFGQTIVSKLNNSIIGKMKEEVNDIKNSIIELVEKGEITEGVEYISGLVKERNFFAILMQKIETYIMDTVRGLVHSVGHIHDAILTTEKIDTDWLTQEVFNRTGFHINFSQKVLG